ncbi:acyltransferase family protein [Streptomyces sp. NPDC002773]|uniref:acyltransferase family protein n=1 Tax=Streptomyces sp. NPDC002773 TaxID=3154430 RepID=UPI0033303D5B
MSSPTQNSARTPSSEQREAEKTPATPVPAPQNGATRAATARDPYFDNAKYLAILLVVMGHLWPAVIEGSRATRGLYMLVYAFHMPVFILISGYLSRSYTGRPDQLKRLLTGVAVPYVVFEVAYTLFTRWGTGGFRPISLLHPTYLMWFLIALFIWRLTTPFWRVVRWPVTTSLVIAGLASVTPAIGAALDLTRVLQLLPFFVIGLSMKPEHFALLRRRPVRIASAVVLVAAVPFFYWQAPAFYLNWFYRSRSVQELGAGVGWGMFLVALLFVGTLVLAAAFLSLVPGTRRWFTALGAGTICGYVLHGFLIRGATYLGFFEDYPWLSTATGRVAVTVIAMAAITLLCTPPVRKALKWVTEPEMSWAFRKETPAAKQA